MNRLGQPIRLFSVNRWISTEIWYDACHTANFLRRFQFTKQDATHWKIIDQWVENMLHLFSPQIIWLNYQRDENVKKLIAQNPDINFFENKPFEELSEIKIDVAQQIQWILK